MPENIEIPELKETYHNFIGFYDNVFPDGFCEHIITQFDNLQNNGLVGSRQNEDGNPKKFMKDDRYFFLNVNTHNDDNMKTFHGQEILSGCNVGLQRMFDHYSLEYDILKAMRVHSTCVKIQKTEPGQGYHLWHCEQFNSETGNRCLVWAVYLNDIDDAGETEFLYQKMRVKPRKNMGMIWPASFTHTHRGNVVFGDKSKYILTGWFYLE